MSSEQDPREIVTPDAFSVSPDLLGLPLAHPWRRAAAILIDLALIGLLANARGVLLAVAAGLFLFWLAFRGRKAGLGSGAARAAIGCGGAVVVFVSVLAIWTSLFLDEDTVLFEAEGEAGEVVPVTLGAAADFMSIIGTSDTAEAEAAARRVVERLRDEGVETDEIRGLIDGMDGGEDDALARAIDRALDASEPTPRPALADLSLDSLLTTYAAARAAGDTATERTTAAPLGRSLARAEWEEREREIDRLRSRADRLAGELSDTERALAEERNRGIVATITGFLDELGLGIGWSGLYFTFLTAFFRGRTPGKRALGIRVLRLDGGSLSYWVAFERFGGYAASLFTGMEGFLRILWDRNRQCLQDKLAETVVIRETKKARAQLAVGAVRRGTSEQPWKGGAIPGT